MPVWYPSVVCNLQLRFDEAFNVQEDDSPSALSPAQAEQNSQAYFGPATVRPLILSGSKDKLTQVGGRQVKSGTLELNGLRQAHTFDLILDWRDIPIDPRLIRDMRVEAFMGLVQPSAFGRGVTRANQDGTRDSIIDTTLSSTNRTNLLLVGLTDEIDVEHTERGSYVHITGRDLRGILLDAKADPRIFRDLDLSRNIAVVVLQILSKLPYGSQIDVWVQSEEWPNGVIPSPASSDGVTRVRLGADGKQNPLSTPQGPGDQIAFWDLITKYCTLVGAVPHFDGIALRIRPLRSLYAQINFDGTMPTPFAGGKPRQLKLAGKTESINIRRFVFGRDLLSVKFSRKLHGQKSPVVECVSIDTSSGKRGLQKLIIARWPAVTGAAATKIKAVEKASKTSVSPSGQVSQTEVLRFPIAGIKSKAALQQIAQNLYEEIGRNELGGQASTMDFASFNTDKGDDPDLITLMPGDACQLVVDRTALSSARPATSPYTAQARQSFAEAVAEIAKRTGDENLARVLVATARNAIIELQDTFRTKNVKYTIEEGGKIRLDFDFENYIEVRSAAPNPTLPQTTSKPQGKAAAKAQ